MTTTEHTNNITGFRIPYHLVGWLRDAMVRHSMVASETLAEAGKWYINQLQDDDLTIKEYDRRLAARHDEWATALRRVRSVQRLARHLGGYHEPITQDGVSVPLKHAPALLEAVDWLENDLRSRLELGWDGEPDEIRNHAEVLGTIIRLRDEVASYVPDTPPPAPGNRGDDEVVNTRTVPFPDVSVVRNVPTVSEIVDLRDYGAEDLQPYLYDCAVTALASAANEFDHCPWGTVGDSIKNGQIPDPDELASVRKRYNGLRTAIADLELFGAFEHVDVEGPTLPVYCLPAALVRDLAYDVARSEGDLMSDTSGTGPLEERLEHAKAASRLLILAAAAERHLTVPEPTVENGDTTEKVVVHA